MRVEKKIIKTRKSWKNMNYLIIVGLALIVPAVIVGNSLLDESQRYVLTLDEKSSNDLYLEFYEVASEKNRQMALPVGQ